MAYTTSAAHYQQVNFDFHSCVLRGRSATVPDVGVNLVRDAKHVTHSRLASRETTICGELQDTVSNLPSVTFIVDTTTYGGPAWT